MTDAERIDLLVAALQWSAARFGGTETAAAMVRAGVRRPDWDGLVHLMGEGSSLANGVLAEVGRPYTPYDEVERTLGGRIAAAAADVAELDRELRKQGSR